MVTKWTFYWFSGSLTRELPVATSWRPSPVSVECLWSESASRATRQNFQIRPAAALLHQDWPDFASKNIDPGTDDLWKSCSSSEQQIRLGPQCGEEDGTILGFRKDQHLVEHEFYGNPFETKAQG